MGCEQAAIALAVVSTKDPAQFRTTPGGYFHGMVAKAKAGALNLDRTLWAMRRAAEPKPPPNTARERGLRQPPARGLRQPPANPWDGHHGQAL
jgi:Replication protein C C-terminal region